MEAYVIITQNNTGKFFWKGELKCNGEIGIKVKTGEVDDYMSDGILTVWMNKKVYDKLMNNEYHYKSQPYSDPPIKVFNSNNEEIDLLYDKVIEKRNL